MPRPEDRFPSTDRKVLRRLDESAIRQVALGIGASLLSFVAVVWIGDLWVHWPKLTVLFGAAVAIGALCQTVLILFFENLYPRGPQRWRRQFSVLLVTRAGIWAAFVLALLQAEGGGGLFFLAMFLPLTLGAALSATWLADIWTVRLYLLVSFLPPIVWLLLAFAPDTLLVAVFLAAFLYALLRVAETHRNLFWRAMSRRDAGGSAVPLTGGVHGRLLQRAAEELRRPVATVSDALTIDDLAQRPDVRVAARRAAQQLIDRLESMDDAARLLRGERVAMPVAGSLRRRCEEAADDIGIVAADGGVLCTTQYDPELPERLRMDYGLLFRALRAMSVWVLEQMPPGGELRIRFEMAAGQQEDRLRCAIDVHTLYLSDGIRTGLDRNAQGGGVIDPDVPLPLAIAGEIAGLLGGRLLLIGDSTHAALSLEAKLDVVEQTERDNLLRAPLRGRAVLLAGGTDALAAALAIELRALDMTLAHCAADAAAIGEQTANQDVLLVLLDARQPAAAGRVLRALKEARFSRRLVLLAPGAEAPEFPDSVPRPMPDWVQLPLGRRRLRQLLARAAGIDEQAPASAAASTPLRVLVVEDNPVNQLVARGMLEKLGCEVEVLGDGAAAVERLPRGGVDLVLMDCEMPGMDGSEATRRIRAREAEQSLPRLPIVAMTAHSGDSEVAGFLAAGMDDCIAKPVSLAALASRIERFRQRR